MQQEFKSYPALIERSLLVEFIGEIRRSDDDERLSVGESVGVASELESWRLCSTVTCFVGDLRDDLSAICFILLTRCNIFGGLLPRLG